MSSVTLGRIGTLAFATSLSQVIVVATAPLLTRIYTPDQFGALAVFTAILATASIVACLRFDYALLVPEESREAESVAQLALWTTVLVSAVSLGLIAMFRSRISVTVGVPELSAYLWLLPLGILSNGWYSTYSRWAVRVRGFTILAHSQVLNAAGASMVQVGLGLLPALGGTGLIAGTALATTAGLASLRSKAVSGSAYPRLLSPTNFAGLSSVAKRFSRFPAISAPASAINTLVVQAPFIIVAIAFGPTVVGVFALSQRVLGLPLRLLGKAVGEVYIGDAAAAVRSRRTAALGTSLLRSFSVLLLISTTMIGLFSVFAPDVFTWAFGNSWRTGGNYVRALAPMYILGFAAAPFGSVLEVLQRQDLYFYREALRAILIVGTLVISIALGASDVQVMATLGIAGALGYLAFIAFSWWAIRDHNVSHSAPDRDHTDGTR